MNILIVEDNEADRNILKIAFNSACPSAKLTLAENGEKALAGLNSGALPDLILLDLNLPGMAGVEVLETLKQNKGTKKIPVIILSSSSNPKEISACYDNFANCYLNKPMSFTELKDLIKLICDFWIGKVKFAS